MDKKPEGKEQVNGRRASRGVSRGPPVNSPPPIDNDEYEMYDEENDINNVDSAASEASEPQVTYAQDVHPKTPLQKTKQSHKTTRKPKQSYSLKTEKEEESVFEFIGENPLLWNSKSKDFRNKQKKQKLWQLKGDELGYSGEHLMKWWSSMRDWYTSLDRTKYGRSPKDNTERENWLIDQLTFYKNSVRHRAVPVKRVNRTTQVKKEIAADYELVESVEDVGLCDATTDSAHAWTNSVVEAPSVNTVSNDRIISRIQTAEDELRSARQALQEPTGERTAFMQWVNQVINTTTEENFYEFQDSFIAMQSRWKQAARQAQGGSRNTWYVVSTTDSMETNSSSGGRFVSGCLE